MKWRAFWIRIGSIPLIRTFSFFIFSSGENESGTPDGALPALGMVRPILFREPRPKIRRMVARPNSASSSGCGSTMFGQRLSGRERLVDVGAEMVEPDSFGQASFEHHLHRL